MNVITTLRPARKWRASWARRRTNATLLAVLGVIRSVMNQPRRATVTIFEAMILRNRSRRLMAIADARARGIPEHETCVLVSFDHGGQMRVEVNQLGGPRHRAVMLAQMAPDNLAAPTS